VYLKKGTADIHPIPGKGREHERTAVAGIATGISLSAIMPPEWSTDNGTIPASTPPPPDDDGEVESREVREARAYVNRDMVMVERRREAHNARAKELDELERQAKMKLANIANTKVLYDGWDNV
jgi:hypothetical protein